MDDDCFFQAAGEWPVPALQETDVAPPTGARLASVNSAAAVAANSTASSSDERKAATPTNAAHAAAPTAAVSAGESERTETGSKSEEAAADEKAKAAAARARASTLDLYFRKLMKRAAEVVAELCLRRLQLPGDTADQVEFHLVVCGFCCGKWTSGQFCLLFRLA